MSRLDFPHGVIPALTVDEVIGQNAALVGAMNVNLVDRMENGLRLAEAALLQLKFFHVSSNARL